MIRRPRTTRHGAFYLMFVLALGVALVGAGCGGAAEEPAEEPAPAAEPEPEPEPEMVSLDRSVLADETRPDDERTQDEHRRSIDVYEFFGVQPGQTVADVWPGGGYNTHLLSRLVGESGSVFAIMEFYADPDGQFATIDALTERIETASLDNVTIANSLGDVSDDSLDVAIAVRNYHDAEQLGAGRAATAAELFRIVKPGGVAGIVEVATDRPGWDDETHRLNESVVIEELTAAGFELEGSSDLLANPDDDHSTSGFNEGRHTMDRYVLKFRKPAGMASS